MSIAFDSIFPADVVEVQNKPYLFTNMRVERDTIPEGLCVYDVRDACDGCFWEVKPYVMVNHWATIIGLEPIVTDENGSYVCEPEEGNEECSSEGYFIDYDIKDLKGFTERYGRREE